MNVTPASYALSRTLVDLRGDTANASDAYNGVYETLAAFGEDALQLATRACIRVVPLRKGEQYGTASREIADMGASIDNWPTPPAGIFVVRERCVYLRSYSPMCASHEFSHALDCALGQHGRYHSASDPDIANAFAAAREFVTNYACVSRDEYFAESLRAFLGVNEPASPWPTVSRERLKHIDPSIHDYIERLFSGGFRQALATAA